MGDELQHKCSISLMHDLPDMYDSLKRQAHRGRDEWGIAAYSPEGIDIIKVAAQPGRFMDLKGITNIFAAIRPLTRYKFFIGQTRYATSYEKSTKLDLGEGGPHRLGGEVIENNWCYRVVKGAEAVVAHNGEVNRNKVAEKFPEGTLRTNCDSEAFLYWWKINGGQRVIQKIPGAYTAIFADITKKQIEVLRDRHGIRPGVIGRDRANRPIVTSEDIAIKKGGGSVIGHLTPGTVYYINQDGTFTHKSVLDPVFRRCFMDGNYIHNPESAFDGIPIANIRRNHGIILASEYRPPGLDFVSDYPRSPGIAARSYADAAEVDYLRVFNKINDLRSFIGPNPEERAKVINEVLFPIPGIKPLVEGKEGLWIDDSMIRANNIVRGLAILAELGLKKAHFAFYTPPYGVYGEDGRQRFCNMGFDTKENDDYVARDLEREVNRTIPEIEDEVHKRLQERHETDIDFSLYYLSHDGMFRSYEESGIPRETLCSFCIGGQHPFETLEEII